MSRDKFTASIDKRANVNECENNGEIADSKEVRIELIAKVESGEYTPAEMQKELRRIKRNAKKNGKKTRAQAWNEG